MSEMGNQSVHSHAHVTKFATEYAFCISVNIKQRKVIFASDGISALKKVGFGGAVT